MRNVAALAILIRFNDDSRLWLTFLGHHVDVECILLVIVRKILYTVSQKKRSPLFILTITRSKINRLQ